MTVYTVSIDVSVEDPRRAYKEARSIFLAGYVVTRENVRDVLRDAQSVLRYEGCINEAACAQWLLDPGVSPAGCSILESRVD
jgi:hypothetical protein